MRRRSSRDTLTTSSNPVIGDAGPRLVARLPLLRRFPALARVPRVALGTFPTPVERVSDPSLHGELWVKRDDLDAASFGGNKVRALEFLLGSVEPGDLVLTGGGEGSTHVLATAAHAATLGANTRAVRWRHDMHPMAERVAERAAAISVGVSTHRTALGAFARIIGERCLGRARWIPLGGTSPLGMLGHVNAALELAEQIAAGAMPAPSRVVVPLGSGGTAAGLALGFWIAGLDTCVVGARVAPRIAANASRVHGLARGAARLIARLTGERVSAPPRERLAVVHDVYGGAYGRPLDAAQESAALMGRACGVALDHTYSAKAFTAALALARAGDPCTLFWLTFDARWMRSRA